MPSGRSWGLTTATTDERLRRILAGVDPVAVRPPVRSTLDPADPDEVAEYFEGGALEEES
ncbi:MAG: hypothetical protein JO325_09905 [Solirubrobacterales bacterium]|nr:hypothetical protein [Solirubrobacterales bacterium]